MGSQILVLLELDENSRQVVNCLSQAGFDVLACQTFTEAMDVLDQHPKIEMIISDVHLQNGGTVFDFLRWLRASDNHSGTSLVFFSFKPTELAKHLEDGIRTAARLLGVKKYITMDCFDSALFCKKIQLVIAEQHGYLDQQLDDEIRMLSAVHAVHS
ncbi:MAG: response regulator [Cyanobacteria bacterium REEB67]|nr:response regulator [Cyanobacteria bacterium REEB67]